MRLFRHFLMIGFVAALATPAVAQETRLSYLIAVDRFSPVSSARTINELVREGYSPFAFDIDAAGRARTILWRSPQTDVSAARFELFEEIDELEGQMNDIIEAGWLPVDITRRQDAFLVVFVETTVLPERWAISTFEYSEDVVERALAAGLDENLYLFGMTYWDGFVSGLYVLPESPLFNSVEVVKMPVVELEGRVEQRVRQGFIPFSIMHVDDDAYVMYVTAE